MCFQNEITLQQYLSPRSFLAKSTHNPMTREGPDFKGYRENLPSLGLKTGCKSCKRKDSNHSNNFYYSEMM